jgi:hypothetical protein
MDLTFTTQYCEHNKFCAEHAKEEAQNAAVVESLRASHARETELNRRLFDLQNELSTLKASL